MRPSSVGFCVRGGRLAAGLALLVVACAARSPREELDQLLLARVTEKLASTEAADVAWGGYLAHRYRLEPTRNALLGALERWRETEGIEARVVRLHLVDGLLGAGANVPALPLEPLLQDPLTRQGAFALIARQPVANQEEILWAAMQPAEASDPVRKHAAQVVVDFGLRSSAYAKFLLEHLRCRFVVHVVDEGTKYGPWNSAVGLGGFTQGLKRMRGFPPLVRIDLGERRAAQETLRGAMPLVGGYPLLISREEDVVYKKDELQRGKLEASPGLEVIEKTLVRMAQSKLDAVQFQKHDWVSVDDYLLRVVAARDAMAAELDIVVAGLRKRGWLDAEDLPGFRIALAVEIDDDRGDRSTPLPVLPAVPATNAK